MIVKVRMTAYMHGEIREVNIPDYTPPEDVLGAVFHYGQNDFQPVPDRPSVSVGDVIEYNGLHLVAPLGFREITNEDYAHLMTLHPAERVAHAYGFED